MAETIRIAIDNVTLEVNDNGDTIVLPLSDERFIKRLSDYIEKMQSGSKELQELSNNSEESIISDIVMADINYHTVLKENFNDVFGKNAYEKVFGDDVIVGVEYVLEFIEQIMPYVEKHQQKRATKFAKYSADRVGSST